MRTQEEMKKDPLVIQVSWGDLWYGVKGSGEIIITEIAGAAGVKRYGLVDMPLNQARKVCKFLIKHSNPALWDLIDEEFSANEKLYKIWRAEVEKSNAVR